MSIFGRSANKRDIIVVGASAGGVEVLTKLVSQFPEDFPAAVFIVLHIPAEYPSKLPQILARHCSLPVVHPDDEEVFENGRVYVAPSDFHLLLDKNKVRLSRGPRENHWALY
jgi:two-component system chemotaxis response regulator CheB